MNVLFLTIYTFNNLTDRHFATDLIREFVDNGHNVYAVTTVTDEKDDGSFTEEYGAKVLRLKLGSIQKVGAVKKLLNILKLDKVAIRELKKYTKDIKFDVVIPIVSNQVYLKTAEYIKKRDTAKVYMLMKDMFPENACDFGMLKKTGLKGIIYRYFAKKEKRYYDCSDKIGFMTEGNVAFAKQNCPYLTDDKVEVNPNSVMPEYVDVTETEKKELKKKYSIPEDKKIVIYGGNLGAPQGVDFLLDVISRNKREDVVYFIAGAGTRYSEIEQSIRSGLKNCILVPMLDAREYAKLLKISTVGIVSLDKRFTVPNCPSRVLSYLEASLPMIYTVGKSCDMAFIAEKNGFGYYVENGDKEEYFKKLDFILDDEELRKCMQKNAHTYLETKCTTKISYDLILKAVAK